MAKTQTLVSKKTRWLKMAGFVLVVPFVAGLFLAAPLTRPVGADSSDPVSVDSRQAFDNQLCPALKSLNQNVYKKQCTDYMTQAAQNKAAQTICKAFKTQLKTECAAYNGSSGVAPGSTKQIYIDKPSTSKNSCGGPGNSIQTTIDFGCVHKGNAITDMLFAIIRFLSDGAGLVLVASLVWAGLQYTGSRGDPQATALAVKRIHSVVISLFIFIFAYAILNFLIPGQLLK